jgi:heme-degrading monooxygenase HmoA
MIDIKTKFISVLIFRVSPDDLPEFARESSIVMQRRVPLISGFVEGAVMANEEKTECLIVTQWHSRDAWGAAQWNESMESALANLVESARAWEVHTYEPITVVRAS